MAKPAQTLYRLQVLDSELTELRSKLREVEGSLHESPELLEARRARQSAEAEVATWRSRLRDAEFELHKVSEKIKASEDKLYGGKVTNPKELGSLEQELDSTRKARSRLEDDVLLAMTQGEEWEKTLAEATTHLTAIEIEWRSAQDKLGKEAEKLRARIALLVQKRGPLVAQVPPDAMAVYEDLFRKKGGRAVVLLEGNMCQGCRVTLPSGKAQAARQALDPTTCPNCGRILNTEP